MKYDDIDVENIRQAQQIETLLEKHGFENFIPGVENGSLATLFQFIYVNNLFEEIVKIVGGEDEEVSNE